MKERIVEINENGNCEVQRWRWWFPFWLSPLVVNDKYNHFSNKIEAETALKIEKEHSHKKRIRNLK